MELEQVKANLLGDARKQAEELIKQAEKEAKKKIKEKEQEIKQEVEKARAKAEEQAKEQEKEEIARAKVEAKIEIAEAKAEAVDLQIEKLYEYMNEKIANDKRYKEFVKAKIAEGKKAFKDPKIKVDKRLKLEEPMDDAGVYIESKDGKVILDYRLRTLFEEKKPWLRKKIYEALFK